MVKGVRKSAIIVIVSLAICLTCSVLGVIAFGLWCLHSSAEMGTMPWTEKVALPEGVTMELPFPVTRKLLAPTGAAVRLFSEIILNTGDKAGVVLKINSYVLQPGKKINLGTTSTGMDSVMLKQWTKVEDDRDFSRAVLGEQGIEYDHIATRWKVRHRVRTLYFVHGNTLFQVRMIAGYPSKNSELTWNRLVEGIRFPEEETGKIAIPP